MTMTKTKAMRFKDFKAQLNQESVESLFQQYERIGFLYPEKKALLAPHLESITKNWKKMLESNGELLWIFSNLQEDNSKFSSVSAWKQTNTGMLAQHLVSDGNPFLSLKVMLAAAYHAEHHFTRNEVNSSQNWFRQNNRYAYRIFASMYDKLGPKRASLRLFHFLNLPLDQITAHTATDFELSPVRSIDVEFINFVRQQYGEVFVQAEELDQTDILLTKLNAKFNQYGLQRYRKVVKVRCKKSRKIVASAIINRAPLGINFSFLENKSYYILAESLTEQERLAVLKELNATIKIYYQDFALQAIPIVTDELTAKTLEKLNANFLRTYMQSIWMRSGFAAWFDHINSFLLRIEARQLRQRA